MKKYTIELMAIKGGKQIKLSEQIIEDEEISFIEIGQVQDFAPLHADTKLQVWITETEE